MPRKARDSGKQACTPMSVHELLINAIRHAKKCTEKQAERILYTEEFCDKILAAQKEKKP